MLVYQLLYIIYVCIQTFYFFQDYTVDVVYEKIRVRDTQTVLDEDDLLVDALDKQERDLEALPGGPMEVAPHSYSWLQAG